MGPGLQDTLNETVSQASQMLQDGDISYAQGLVAGILSVLEITDYSGDPEVTWQVRIVRK